MKLSLSQALATILNIQVTGIPPQLRSELEPKQMQDQMRQAFVIGSGLVGTHLGYLDQGTTLEQAVCKAVIECDLKQPSGFAIFPIGSDRENIYMAIERELLRQEQALGQKMWEQLGKDPRELITLIMEQLRECATSVVNPSLFQISLLRVCCLCIACMSWVSDWLVRLKVRASVLQQQKDTVHIVPVEVGIDELTKQKIEPPPPLFGAGGPGAIKVLPSPEIYTCDACGTQVPDKDMPLGECCPKCGEPRN